MASPLVLNRLSSPNPVILRTPQNDMKHCIPCGLPLASLTIGGQETMPGNASRKGITTMKGKGAAVQPALAHTSMTAIDVMERPVVAATPRASLRDIAGQLVTNEFSGMPVADSDGRVVGVITESDLVRTLLEGKRLESVTAAEAMTGPAITVDVTTPFEDIMKCLEENRILRVPVVKDDRLVGIISRRDVIKAVLEPEFIAFGGASVTAF